MTLMAPHIPRESECFDYSFYLPFPVIWWCIIAAYHPFVVGVGVERHLGKRQP